MKADRKMWKWMGLAGLLAVLGWPAWSADDDGQDEGGDANRSRSFQKSTIQTYRRTDWQEETARREALGAEGGSRTTLKTYRRGGGVKELLDSESEPAERPSRSTLKTYRRGDFEKKALSGELQPGVPATKSDLETYRQGADAGRVQYEMDRLDEKVARLTKLRDSMAGMGNAQLVERLDRLIEREQSYTQSKLVQLGCEPEVAKAAVRGPAEPGETATAGGEGAPRTAPAGAGEGGGEGAVAAAGDAGAAAVPAASTEAPVAAPAAIKTPVAPPGSTLPGANTGGADGSGQPPPVADAADIGVIRGTDKGTETTPEPPAGR